MTERLHWLVAALVLGVGIALCGWFVAQGLIQARTGDRYVTVKGLAERPVEADLAHWSLRFVVTDNDLDRARSQLSEDEQAIRRFLADYNLAEDAIELGGLEVTDLLAQAYRNAPIDSRFILAQTIVVRTGDIDAVTRASQAVGDLLDAGVVLGGQGQAQGLPAYIYTELNDIKPDMLAEATAQARAAAEQFAADSDSRVGAIRSASQGVFQILARNAAPNTFEPNERLKTVRVVTTIEYRLVD